MQSSRCYYASRKGELEPSCARGHSLGIERVVLNKYAATAPKVLEVAAPVAWRQKLRRLARERIDARAAEARYLGSRTVATQGA